MYKFITTLLLFGAILPIGSGQLTILDGGGVQWTTLPGVNAAINHYNTSNSNISDGLTPMHLNGVFDIGMGYRVLSSSIELLYHYSSMTSHGKTTSGQLPKEYGLSLKRFSHSVSCTYNIDVERWGAGIGMAYHFINYKWTDEASKIKKMPIRTSPGYWAVTGALHYAVFQSDYIRLTLRPYVNYPVTHQKTTQLYRLLGTDGPTHSKELTFGLRILFSNGPQS